MNLLPFHRGNNLKFCLLKISMKSPRELILNIESLSIWLTMYFSPLERGLPAAGLPALCNFAQWDISIHFWVNFDAFLNRPNSVPFLSGFLYLFKSHCDAYHISRPNYVSLTFLFIYHYFFFFSYILLFFCSALEA